MSSTMLKKMSLLSAVTMIAACSPSGTQNAATNSKTTVGTSQVDTEKEALISFKLTDAPNKDLKSVVVNIDHMEVVVAGGGKAGRLILAQNLGPVDLLTLQNGVTLPLQDVVAPAGLQIQQIRLILKSEGHFAVKDDDSTCELKTPSAQKTGVKIILTNKVQFEAGHQYNIVVDFDALKSVVIQGNGGCLLKPVLKLKSALKVPIIVDPLPDDGSDDGDSTTVDDGTGTDPGAGSETDDGTELVTDPDQNQNDPTTDDGWDYTPIVDGEDFPIVTEDQLVNLL